jgi:hypothetical protein
MGPAKLARYISLLEISPPEADRAGCASFTRKGKTKGLRRKALNFTAAPTSDTPK